MGRIATLAGPATAVALAMVAWACVDVPTTECADGRVCPSGLLCDDTHSRCVQPDQLETCVGALDDSQCLIGGSIPGRCSASVCVVEGCGDGFVHGIEQCDGDDLDGKRWCYDLVGHWQDGTLRCTEDCTFDLSQCTEYCGDDSLNSEHEQCDGELLAGMTDCTQFGFYDSGAIACTNLCQYDLSGCTGFCGDGEVNGPEDCDGPPPLVGVCTDFGFAVGALTCSALCAPAYSQCGEIGWVQSPMEDGTIGIWGQGDDFVVAVGEDGDGGARIQVFNGIGWASMATPVAPTLRGVWGASAKDVFAVGDGGTILHFDGSAWTSMESGASSSLTGIWGAASDDVYAIGSDGVVLHYDGSAWSPFPSPSTGDLLSIWGSSPDNIFTSTGDYLYRYDGGSWSEESFPYPVVARQLWGRSATDMYLLSSDGLFHYDGVGWSVVSFFQLADLALQLVAIHGTPGGHVYVLSTRSPYPPAEFVHQFDGHAWATTALPRPVRAVWASSSRSVLAVGGASFEYRGAAWTSQHSQQCDTLWGLQSNALYCEAFELFADKGTDFALLIAAPEGFNNLSGVSGSAEDDVWTYAATPGSNGRLLHWNGSVWEPEDVDFDGSLLASLGPKNVYAGSENLSTLHFGNGSSWTPLPPPVGISYGAFHAVGPGNLVAVGAAGEVAHFDGSNWTTASVPTTETLLDVWASGPNNIYAVGEAGTLLHFDGAAWSAIDIGSGDDLFAVTGTAPDDVFVFGALGTALYFDGDRWSPLRMNTNRDLRTALALPTQVLAFTEGGIFPAEQHRIIRTRRWTCRSSESSCGDRVDDDCDGLFDSNDSDCDSAIRLVEVHAGQVDYLEIESRTTEPSNLHNMSIYQRWDCDVETQKYSFPPDAIVLPGEHYRVIDDDSQLQIRERVANYDMCQTPGANGWVALCAGECDLDACSNVIDYLELGPSPPSPPACASFSPDGVDISGAGSGDSVVRGAFTGLRANGVASDWAVGTATRD